MTHTEETRKYAACGDNPSLLSNPVTDSGSNSSEMYNCLFAKCTPCEVGLRLEYVYIVVARIYMQL